MVWTVKDRVAIVTGASAGIGRAVVRDLLRGGAHVIANARRAEKLEELKAEVNEDARLVTVAGDASERSVIASFFQQARMNFGRSADLVVVNAGRGLPGSLTTSDESQWEDLFKTNIFGALQLMRAAARDMLEQGVPPNEPRDIVVLGSCVGRNVIPLGAAYSATKFAVHAGAEALRRELCSKGIRVSLVEPGIVQTEFHVVADYGEHFYEKVEKERGPLIMSEDVSRVIGFIVSQPPHVHINDIAIRPLRQEYP